MRAWMPLAVGCLTILSIATTAVAAPSKEEVKSVAGIFDFTAVDDLAVLRVCGKPELETQYLHSLIDAGLAYPKADPKKVTALIRQIQRKASSLAESRTRFNQSAPPTPEEFEEGCRFDVRQAEKRIETLDDFIFKS